MKVADIVQVKGEQKNRGEWKIGLITKTILVSNVLVSAKIKLRKIALMECPVQMLHPFEISNDLMNNEDKSVTGL